MILGPPQARLRNQAVNIRCRGLMKIVARAGKEVLLLDAVLLQSRQVLYVESAEVNLTSVPTYGDVVR
jgi:hypothetical protein